MADTLKVASAIRDSITVASSAEPPPKTVHGYADVDKLEATATVRSKQRVALIQHYLNAPRTETWGEGEAVMGNTPIATGTPVATFVDGKYLGKKSGNHGAFYLKQDANGFTVMDLWANDVAKPKVSSRYLRKKGKNEDGTCVNPSNNADAYSIALW